MNGKGQKPIALTTVFDSHTYSHTYSECKFIVRCRYISFIKSGEHFIPRNSATYNSGCLASVTLLQDVGRFRLTWGTIAGRTLLEQARARAGGSRFIYETAISGSVGVPPVERGIRGRCGEYIRDMVGCTNFGCCGIIVATPLKRGRFPFPYTYSESCTPVQRIARKSEQIDYQNPPPVCFGAQTKPHAPIRSN
jgi:hypothetical protein